MQGKGRHFMAGLLSGLALGILVVLLLTRVSGWETRRLLAEKGQRLKGEAEEIAPAIRRAPGICLQGVRKILDGLLLLARGDVEEFCQNLGLGSKWLVIG